jgi:hypothetical protein
MVDEIDDNYRRVLTTIGANTGWEENKIWDLANQVTWTMESDAWLKHVPPQSQAEWESLSVGERLTDLLVASEKYIRQNLDQQFGDRSDPTIGDQDSMPRG